jgi:23S rRNA pseudouridine2604 synthase
MAERAKLSLKSCRPAPREPGRAPVRAATAPRPAPSSQPSPPVPRREAIVAPPAPAAREGERLSKRMTALGLASRREADAWIDAGWVRVDGVVARLGQRVQPGQRIDIEAQARHHQQRQVTILLHKPLGVVSGQAEDGHALAPARVSWANEDRLRIVLREGRKRQIRRMCEQVGLRVLDLQRVRIGRVVLGALPPGQWRYLGGFERF